MSRLNDRLISHPLRGSLTQLRQAADAISGEVLKSLDEAGFDALPDRVRAVCDFVEGVLDSADPALVSVASLDQLQQHATQALNYVQNLPSQGAQYGPHVDGALDALSQSVAPLAAVSSLARRARQVGARRLGEALRGAVQEISQESERLAGELAELRAELRAAHESASQADQQRTEQLETRAAQLEQAIAAQQNRLDQALITFEGQFREAQEAHELSWDTARKEHEKAAAKAVAALQSSGQDVLADVESRADEVLADAEVKRERVEKLYGLITDKATSGAFGDEATAQKKAADEWRRNAVKLGLLSAAFAVGAVSFAAIDEHGSSTAHIGAIVVAILLSGLTAYAAKQSGSHRVREVRAKRLELELTAFGPFTDSLENPEQARSDYAERLFRGADDAPLASGDDHVTIAQSLGQGFIDVLKARLPGAG